MHPTRASQHGGFSRLIGRLAAEKKKCVVAAFLIGVMVLMWAKVLTGKGPNAAAAAHSIDHSGQMESSQAASGSQSRMFCVQLPKVKGRNDVLNEDFFTVNSWRSFVATGRGSSRGVEEVFIESGDHELETKLAGQLRLEAIKMGPSPRAFINDKLVGVGDKLLVGDGKRGYEYEIMGINENRVILKYGQLEVVLKLSDAM